MNVLSLFDGMSCGQIALEKAGIPISKYHASEIDKYAIQVTQHNYPNTIQLGDVTQVRGEDLPKIDLLIGGSPCQGFSSAGKQLNFEDPRSKLFFEYVRLLKECEPKYFLLENVVMKKEWSDIISEYLGVKPILINSSLVSAQNRRRLYWTNIPNVQQPEDQNIYWKDVQMDNAKDVYYVTDKMMAWVNKNPKRKNKFKIYEKTTKEKMQMLEASHHKGISNQRCFAIRDNDFIRYIHPVECERLQNVSDGYTQVVSNTQRYRMLGNGWTVNVVAHIFKNIGQEPIPFEEFKKPNTLF